MIVVIIHIMTDLIKRNEPSVENPSDVEISVVTTSYMTLYV